jgi:monoamine oxidase
MLDLKRDEHMTTPAELLDRYVGALPRELADPRAPRRAFARWEAYERLTWPEWLRSRGASPDAVRLMTVGGDSSSVSALYVLRQYAMLRASTQRYKIGGGMDRLPTAMAASLSGIIRYNAPVVRVERQSTGFRVDYREGAALKTMAAARVGFAVPASTMRQIDMKPRLSRVKEQAIEQLLYYDGVRFPMPVLASAESGLHFAGEHTSIWTGWMEGALESGERAARELLNATGRSWPEQTGPTR